MPAVTMVSSLSSSSSSSSSLQVYLLFHVTFIDTTGILSYVLTVPKRAMVFQIHITYTNEKKTNLKIILSTLPPFNGLD